MDKKDSPEIAKLKNQLAKASWLADCIQYKVESNYAALVESGPTDEQWGQITVLSGYSAEDLPSEVTQVLTMHIVKDREQTVERVKALLLPKLASRSNKRKA